MLPEVGIESGFIPVFAKPFVLTGSFMAAIGLFVSVVKLEGI
jgi:hypothetical protein